MKLSDRQGGMKKFGPNGVLQSKVTGVFFVVYALCVNIVNSERFYYWYFSHRQCLHEEIRYRLVSLVIFSVGFLREIKLIKCAYDLHF